MKRKKKIVIMLYSRYINTLGTRGILISKSMQLLVDDPSLQNYKKFLKKPFFGIYTTYTYSIVLSMFKYSITQQYVIRRERVKKDFVSSSSSISLSLLKSSIQTKYHFVCIVVVCRCVLLLFVGVYCCCLQVCIVRYCIMYSYSV